MANKYNTSPPDERRYLGRTFGSKAEMRYCQMLERMVSEEIILDYVCQPRIWLGVPENVYVPDFLVVPVDQRPHYVDVKGMETSKFRRDKKLWEQYGRLLLYIVRETSPGKFKTMDILPEKAVVIE